MMKMKKKAMIRRIRKITKKVKPTFKDASAMVSAKGWYKYSNHINLYNKYIKPFIKLNFMKEVIRKWQKHILLIDQQTNLKLNVC